MLRHSYDNCKINHTIFRSNNNNNNNNKDLAPFTKAAQER